MPSKGEKKGPVARRQTRKQTQSENNLLDTSKEPTVHSTSEATRPKDDSQASLDKRKPAEAKSRKTIHEKAKGSKDPYPTSKEKQPRAARSSRGADIGTRSPPTSKPSETFKTTNKAANKATNKLTTKNIDISSEAPLEKEIKENQYKGVLGRNKESLKIPNGKVSKPEVLKARDGEKPRSVTKTTSLPKPMARASTSQLNDIFFNSSRGQVKVYRKNKLAGSFLKLPSDDTRSEEQKKAHADKIKEQEMSMRRIMDFKESLEKSEVETACPEGAKQCPYCGDILEPPFTPILEDAFKDMEDKNKAFEESQLMMDSSARIMHYGNQKREVSNMEQFEFCQMHKTELKIKPEGVKRGYPLEIDFDALPERIKSLQAELERVISQDTPSIYRDAALQAYKDLGQVKARGTMAVMARFEYTLPGYYGSKGAAIMQKVLDTMFVKTNILTHETAAPQLPMEYLQQVLVPETAYRLIREDLAKQGLESQDAKQVMKESSEFGSVVHRDPDVMEHY